MSAENNKNRHAFEREYEFRVLIISLKRATYAILCNM
jgi:hypothetical protein